MMLEAYVNILELMATVFGSIMSLAYFPQAFKIYKRKSSADVSIVTYLIFFPGIVIWLLYGIGLNNFALIISNAIAFVGALTVIAAYFIYRKA